MLPKPATRPKYRKRAEARRESWAALNGRLNAEMMEWDGYLHCEECGANESAVLSRHHVVFRSHGGTDEESNLRLLCERHHREAHHRLTQKERDEKRKSADDFK